MTGTCNEKNVRDAKKLRLKIIRQQLDNFAFHINQQLLWLFFICSSLWRQLFFGNQFSTSYFKRFYSMPPIWNFFENYFQLLCFDVLLLIHDIFRGQWDLHLSSSVFFRWSAKMFSASFGLECFIFVCFFFFIYLFALFNSRRTFFVDKVLGVVDKSIHLRCLYHRSNSYVKAQRWCVENRLIVSEWAYLIICGCAKCYFPVDWSLRMRESAFLSSIYFTFFSLCFVCLQRRCHTIYQSIELIALQIKERGKNKID